MKGIIKHRSPIYGTLALTACFMPSVFVLNAATILFDIVDLPDGIPGQDLWEYRYYVAGTVFPESNGFAITFDRELYGNLQNPPPAVNVDWAALVLQPDPALSSNGIYDALALSGNASLADPFRVSFVWNGTGTPGAQAFQIYDPTFSTIFQGQTVPIPEPQAFLIMASALAPGLLLRSRRKSRYLNNDSELPSDPQEPPGDVS